MNESCVSASVYVMLSGGHLMQVVANEIGAKVNIPFSAAFDYDTLPQLKTVAKEQKGYLNAAAEAAFQEVVAAGRLPGQTDARLPPGVGQEPGVQFSLHLGQLLSRFQSVRGDDQELASGVDDLAGPRQIQRLQHAQRRAFAQQ